LLTSDLWRLLVNKATLRSHLSVAYDRTAISAQSPRSVVWTALADYTHGGICQLVVKYAVGKQKW